jgi:hypothetical protein
MMEPASTDHCSDIVDIATKLKDKVLATSATILSSVLVECGGIYNGHQSHVQLSRDMEDKEILGDLFPLFSCAKRFVNSTQLKETHAIMKHCMPLHSFPPTKASGRYTTWSTRLYLDSITPHVLLSHDIDVMSFSPYQERVNMMVSEVSVLNMLDRSFDLLQVTSETVTATLGHRIVAQKCRG